MTTVLLFQSVSACVASIICPVMRQIDVHKSFFHPQIQLHLARHKDTIVSPKRHTFDSCLGSGGGLRGLHRYRGQYLLSQLVSVSACSL